MPEGGERLLEVDEVGQDIIAPDFAHGAEADHLAGKTIACCPTYRRRYTYGR